MNLNDVFTPCIHYHSITLRLISILVACLYQLSQGIVIYAVTVSKAKNFVLFYSQLMYREQSLLGVL